MNNNVELKKLVSENGTTITVKHVYVTFNQDDSGKLIRRHLRNHFAENHNHKTSWVWDTNNADDLAQLELIIEYFNKLFYAPKDPKPTKIKSSVKKAIINQVTDSNNEKIKNRILGIDNTRSIVLPEIVTSSIILK